jgi:RNA polymerase sigma-70 factor (ECF subfamily)
MTMQFEAVHSRQEAVVLLPPRLVQKAARRAATPTVTDAELVMAMARGDAGALATLYDRHAPHMLALALKIVRAPAPAEDLVHEVFLEAWERAASYDPARGPVVPWLLLRVRSRCLDFLRAGDQSRSSVMGDEFWVERAHPIEGDESVGPDCATMRRALGELPAVQREALLLGYFEGLSCTEIAARIDVPVGTVKTRVARALARLREVLGDTAEPHARDRARGERGSKESLP